MIYFEIAVGLVLLIIGGELIVRGAASVARHMQVSPLLIGLTLVGFGTSMPELVASVQAALANAPGIAVGNVVGSNIANIFLILGVTAVLRPIDTPSGSFRRDGGMVFLATVICTAIALGGFITRWMGAILVALLIAYMAYSYRNERIGPEEAAAHEARMRPGFAALAAIAGLAVVIIGARLLVFGAIHLAREMGISQSIIGLTVVAIGTSLPELAAGIVAALRGHSNIAFGNVIGSNIYNVLGILGVTALVHPIAVPQDIVQVDIWVMFGATILLIIFAVTNWRVTRAEGAAFLTAYVAYIGYLVYSA
jgi:cation:H+ antiporter